MNSPSTSLEPVRKSIVVKRSLQDAFRIFTAEIATWWPLHSHSISGSDAKTCAVECRVGGNLYEEDGKGERHVWGTILQWDPPHRIVFTWHPGRDEETAQEVEIHFVEADGGTLVELEHRDWEKWGEQAQEAHDGYDTGWEAVFVQLYGQACEREA